MTLKLKQTQEEREEGCAHPNLQYDELTREKERRRRYIRQTKLGQANKRIVKNLQIASGLLRRTPMLVSKAAVYYGKAKAIEAKNAGDEFEEKVAEEEKATWTSIHFKCPKCGMEGDLDVVRPDGVVKECKSGTRKNLVSQFKKNARGAARIFGGTPVMHVAVPKGQAGAVIKTFKQSGVKLSEDQIQEH